VGYQVLDVCSGTPPRGEKPLVNLISGLVCGVALFFGASLISYFQSPCWEACFSTWVWLPWNGWLTLAAPAADYLLVWVILIIIAVVGFLQGIIAGIFIAAILFVISYSRINAIKTVLNGSIYQQSGPPKIAPGYPAQKGDRDLYSAFAGVYLFRHDSKHTGKDPLTPA
jgi:SulP family sulfate permease